MGLGLQYHRTYLICDKCCFIDGITQPDFSNSQYMYEMPDKTTCAIIVKNGYCNFCKKISQIEFLSTIKEIQEQKHDLKAIIHEIEKYSLELEKNVLEIDSARNNILLLKEKIENCRWYQKLIGKKWRILYTIKNLQAIINKLNRKGIDIRWGLAYRNTRLETNNNRIKIFENRSSKAKCLKCGSTDNIVFNYEGKNDVFLPLGAKHPGCNGNFMLYHEIQDTGLKINFDRKQSKNVKMYNLEGVFLRDDLVDVSVE